MKSILLGILLLMISCSANKKMTDMENAFHEILKNSVASTVVNELYIYNFHKPYNKSQMLIFDNNTFVFNAKAINVEDILKNQNINFLITSLGKPSTKGKDFLEYYFDKSCLGKDSFCPKIVVNFDAKTKKIISYKSLLAPSSRTIIE